MFAAVVVAELLWSLSRNQTRVISCPGLFDNPLPVGARQSCRFVALLV